MLYPKVVFIESILSLVATNDGVKQLACQAASGAQLNTFFQVVFQVMLMS